MGIWLLRRLSVRPCVHTFEISRSNAIKFYLKHQLGGCSGGEGISCLGPIVVFYLILFILSGINKDIISHHANVSM